MARSENGFLVISGLSVRTSLCYTSVAGQKFQVRTFARKAFQWLIEELNQIESVNDPGWDGGYACRPVRDQTVIWSNHASGTAIDWNASRHNRGGFEYAGWSGEQVEKIRSILGTKQGKCFKWGADFHTVRDPMHFECIEKSLWTPARERAGF